MSASEESEESIVVLAVTSKPTRCPGQEPSPATAHFEPISDNVIEQVQENESKQSSPRDMHDETLEAKDDVKIPLRCNLCPSGLTFSDTSHLLTHMNSKSHIFHHWNLELFKEVNPRIKAALQDFQVFWEEYGLASRIRSRMIKRNQVPRIAADTIDGIPVPDMRLDDTTNGLHETKPKRKLKVPARKKSQPLRRTISKDNQPGGTRSASRSGSSDIKRDSLLTSHNVQDHEWPDHSRRVSPGIQHYYETQATPHWHDHPSLIGQRQIVDSPDPYLHPALGGLGSFLGAPRHGIIDTSRREEYDATMEMTGSEFETKYEPSEDGRSFPSEAATDIVEDMKQDDFRPKGLQFDGMGGFDAASNTQKRKRNQRKDPEVLVQLRANSEMVTTDEHVFDLNFNLQRIRDVFDESEISADEDDDGSTTKRKKKQPTTARPSTSTRKARKPANKLTDKTNTAKPVARTKRASARAAQAAISKLQQPYPDALSPSESLPVSRPLSSLNSISSNHQLSSLVSQNSRAGPGNPRAGLAASSADTNSHRPGFGPSAIKVYRQDSPDHLNLGNHRREAGRSTPLTFHDPRRVAYNFSLNAGKENDPNLFYTGGASGHNNTYFPMPETGASAAYNPLYVQHMDIDSTHMAQYDRPDQPNQFNLQQMPRNAPFPLMHLQQHDGLLHPDHNPSSDMHF